MAYVYRDLCEAYERLKEAHSDAAFLSAQVRYEQVEAEWLEIGKKLDLMTGDQDGAYD